MSLDHSRGAHVKAGRAVTRNLGAYTALTLGQLLIRLVALAPLFYAIATRSFFGVARAHRATVALLCCIPLWLLIVLPCRYRAGGLMSRWLGHQGPETGFSGYVQWLSQGIGRLLKALPWMAPLLFWLGGFYYYMHFAPFNAMGLMIDEVGGVIGGDYVHGVALLSAALLVAVILAYIGWRRMMPFFYLPLKPLHQDGARRRSLKGRGLNKVTLVNFLLVLPPLVISLWVLGASIQNRMTGDIQADMMVLLPAVTQFDFPQADLVRVGLVLLVTYLPFVLWRKTALAAAIHSAPAK